MLAHKVLNICGDQKRQRDLNQDGFGAHKWQERSLLIVCYVAELERTPLHGEAETLISAFASICGAVRNILAGKYFSLNCCQGRTKAVKKISHY